MEKMKVAIALIFTFILGAAMTTGCSSLGSRPEVLDLNRSSHYDVDKGIFVNRRPTIIKDMKDRALSLAVAKEWLFSKKQRVPTQKLPEVKPNIEEFLKPADQIKVIWFGHSTFLLNVEGHIVLVDPVFSRNAAPVSFLVKRFQEPVLSLEELPEVDTIVISHDHYDHLDMGSIQFFKNKKTKFVTPLGVGSHIRGWGISRERITELDWWESTNLNGVEFVATPAQHFSGRSLFDENKTLWASWVIMSERHKIYFSGDTGYDTHFKEIGEKYGPFDIAFIENGQYNKAWKEVHMLPHQASQAYFDLKANAYFPIHWGMFELSLHAWFEPILEITKHAEERGMHLITPKLGEMVTVTEDVTTEDWWSPLIPKEQGLLALRQSKSDL